MVSTDRSRISATSIVKFVLTVLGDRKSLDINKEGYIFYVKGVLDLYTVSVFM